MKKTSKILQNENLPLPTKSLFLEGLRQLKIGGIVYAALCVLVSLGNCADVYSHSDAMQHRYTLSVNIDERFNDNLFFLLFLAVIFLTAASFSVMTFLRSPRARDFYLATPQSSGRLWASFASAVLAWHGIAMGASFIVWLLFALPYDLKSVSVCLVILGSLLASTFLIFALVLLALSLTGRLVSALGESPIEIDAGVLGGIPVNIGIQVDTLTAPNILIGSVEHIFSRRVLQT